MAITKDVREQLVAILKDENADVEKAFKDIISEVPENKTRQNYDRTHHRHNRGTYDDLNEKEAVDTKELIDNLRSDVDKIILERLAEKTGANLSVDALEKPETSKFFFKPK